MQNSLARTLVCVGLAISTLAAPMAAQLCTPPTVTPGFDNRDGYLPPFEEQPVHPMELSASGSELWVANIPDARVSVFDATNPTAPGGPALLAEIAVGLGPVAIRQRPATNEMWVVCTSSNSVFVIDTGTRRVTTTIRVEDEPADLVFNPTGATAYVSVAASNQIAVIDAVTRQVATQRIEFDSILPTTGTSRIHAEEPLTLMLEGTDLYALSHLSGNGTTSNPATCPGATPLLPPVPCFQPTIVPGLSQMWNDFNSGSFLSEPPDRDVFRFDVNSPASPGTVVGWRFGTLNFDLQREPGGANLVVSNVDMNNDQVITEQLYALATLGPFAVHRISRGPDATSATSNTSVAHFDLNAAANVHSALQAQGYSCSFPNQMAFNSAGDRLYVACYGTNNVAVLDYPPTTVLAELRSRASVTNKTGFGTHGLVLDEARGVVHTYEQGDGSLQVYAANPAAGTVNAPLHAPIPIGFDITPANVESGRFHFNDAKNSTFGTDSCGSCHYRAHFDGIAWDLGDISGDLPTQPGQPLPPLNRIIPRDLKGLKVTMSLRGIEETPPFHWRGDRADLQSFGPAQVDLLGGNPLTQGQLQDIDDFVFSISYRPNPDQSFDRTYTTQAVDGLNCFTNPKPLTFGSDTNGGGLATSCHDCHDMAGFSGTNNQVNNDAGINAVTAEDVTQLRGLWDKLSDLVVYQPGTQFIVPATGWGFANPGFVDTFSDFVEGAAAGLQPNERNAIKAFFAELDTGMAPTTAFAWTMDQVSVNAIPQSLVTLFLAGEAGHNEVIARGWMNLGSGPQTIGMFYVPNPSVPLGGLFFTDTTGVGPFSNLALIQAAQAGNAVLNFIGTPVGLGYRLAIDREMDFLFDGDEAVLGTNTSLADTDGDAFPDGYEVRFGTSPTNAASFPTTDTVAPVILGPQIAWRNSNVVKVRWLTDEESVSRVRIRDASNNVVASKQELRFKWQHSLVVRGLIPGQSYTVEIEAEDPANANLPFVPGNLSQVQLGGLNMQPRLFVNSMHVERTTLTVQGTNPNGTVQLQASFEIHDGATSAPLANVPVTLNFNFFEWIPGGVGAITPAPMVINATTNAQGIVSTSFPTVGVLAGQSGVAEVVATNVSESVGFRMLFQVESGQGGFNAKVNLP